MPATYTVLENQNIVDVAVQLYGAESGVLILIEDNPTLSLDRPYVRPAQVLVTRTRQELFGDARANVAVADSIRQDGHIVSNLNPPPAGIGYMQIETDFIVS